VQIPTSLPAEESLLALRQRRREIAHDLDRCIRDKVMPYWVRTTIRSRAPGYQLADSLSSRPRLMANLWSRIRGRAAPGFKERHLVGQSRMLFGFAHVHRAGYSDSSRDYLKAAELGYRFLTRHMLDQEFGGFVWKVDPTGRMIDPRKFLYGQAFAIYGLVEYHRATGLRPPIDLALAAYGRVQEHWHDDASGGWIEHGGRDFVPLSSRAGGGAPEIVGLKSANANLHWLEALAELYDVTGDPGVGASLAECVDLATTRFFPADPEASCLHRARDWQAVESSPAGVVSYGHNVEFAWLLIRAQQVLGIAESWAHFDALLEHALYRGFDHQRGGFFATGRGDQPASDREKIWWVQAEGLAALSEGVRHRPDSGYARALDLLLDWILHHQMLRKDGIWIWSLSAEGALRTPTKASAWKAAYHDVRAMIKFIESWK
jgi:mannose/cellobiose epimerase-like protein (N-acyl-D-glucosamine 2-epimerase family)